MPTGATPIDRLLPRHEPGRGLELTWHIHLERDGLFKKSEASQQAALLEMSLEGALIAVRGAAQHEAGEHVQVRFRGHDGVVEIKHIRDAGDGRTLYGVRFVSGYEFGQEIGSVVGEIRGHSAELDVAWNRQN